ncbi:hypothetical protein HN51_035838, partial [Arachis hypogaea]
ECKEVSVKNMDYKKPAETPSRTCESKLPGSPTEPPGGSKIGTRRKLLVIRPRFGKGSHTARAAKTRKKRSAVVSDSDDDDHVPHVIPKRHLFDHSSSLTGEHLNQDAKQFDGPQFHPTTPSTVTEQVTEYDFDRELKRGVVLMPSVAVAVEEKRRNDVWEATADAIASVVEDRNDDDGERGDGGGQS